MRSFETLIDRPPLRLDAVEGDSADLVLAFASVGQDPERLPSPEFVRAATAEGRRALFVMDGARSWATAPGWHAALEEAVAEMARRRPLGRILAIGSSMGGFAALVAGQILPLTAVLAISPQHRPAAPWERRWRHWTDALPQDLTAPLPQGPYLCLMHGLADDEAQAMGFAPPRGADHLLFDGQNHAGLAGHLKARGLLAGMIAAALARDRRRLLRILQGAGGRRRPQLPR